MINDLNKDELKLLSIISRLVNSHEQADTDNITYLMGIKIPSLLDCWGITAKALVDIGIITCSINSDNKEVSSVTEYGKSFSDEVEELNYLTLCFYNEFYKRAEESKAHSEFCRLVYGEDFCQHGMLDMNQLHKLIEVSKLSSSWKVLELGCGNGFITEYISDRTLCHITGIYIAVEAIEHARERTKSKGDRLLFQTMSMDNLNYNENSFDVVISIDTLYFVKNLENTLESIYRVLKSDDTAYIFYHVPPDVVNCSGSDPAHNYVLGKALDMLNYKYQTIDFTVENKSTGMLRRRFIGVKAEF